MFGQNFVDLPFCPPPVGRVEGCHLFFFAVVVVVRLAAGGRVVLAVADVVIVIVFGDLGFRF